MTTTAKPRILVGVDGSDSSKNALRWAASQARLYGAQLEALTAWSLVPAYSWSGALWIALPGEPDPAALAEKLLVAAIDEVFGEQRPDDLQIVVTEGRAARELIERSEGALMLVVGSRGHGGFAGMLLGSVSAACAEHARCPVLVVHGTSAPV